MFKYLEYWRQFENLRRQILEGMSNREDLKITDSASGWSRRLGILHIGAHLAEEAQEYSNYGLRCTWVEANPQIFSTLESEVNKFQGQNAILATVSNADKEVILNISNNRVSSSYLEIDDQLQDSIYIVDAVKTQATTVDSLYKKFREMQGLSYWVLDTQGSELDILMGAEESIKFCNVLEIEVSTFPIYKNSPLASDIDRFLANLGFVPLISIPPEFHGNTLYIRVH